MADQPHNTPEELYAKRDSSAVRFFVAGLACALLALGAGSWVIVERATHAEHTATTALEIQREVCEDSGNPLRTGLRQDAEAQLYEAEHPDPRVLKALHLQLTPAELHALAQKKILRLKENITERYNPVDCAARYAPAHE